MLSLLILLLWNFVVFGFYAVDKYKARHHLWRISEKILLTLTICGGGAGAFLAGQLLHHKTRKWYFRVAWFLGILIDIGLIYIIFRSKI